MTYQAKQQASELCFNHRDWTDHLPDGYAVETRINSREVRAHTNSQGEVVYCSDMQWYISGHFIEGAGGSALLLIRPDGEEQHGVFRR